MLDLSSYDDATAALSRAIASAQNENNLRNCDAATNETIRAGVIHCFEFTYELSWKFMRRWLLENHNPDVVSGMSRKELIRLAAENSLIDDVTAWWRFGESRNKSSHTYHSDVAVDVFKTSVDMLPYALALQKTLHARND